MRPAEAQALLAIAAAFDNRKPDADSATAWAAALDSLRFEDCREAIVGHYQTTTEWLMPSHVITRVKRLRSARLLEHPTLTPPASLDPDDPQAYTRWLEVTRRRIADGESVEDAAYDGTQQLSEVHTVLRAVPAVVAKPHGHSAEHEARMTGVRAELAARRPIPIPPPLDEETP